MTNTCSAALQNREYNTWYEKDAVLYDITQTADGNPVMISISQGGYKTANMVISLLSEGVCPSESLPLEINGDVIPAEYTCMQQITYKVEHFIVRDAVKVNVLLEHLKSDFTAILQKDIKIWAANIKSPKYGIAPIF
ncbi:TPA: hypothetical protein N5L33_004804 [Enterobacter cloacae subsp. cloacae]|nr:hypothetical protein [Enterobacter cloacae subsp. cloacae]HCM9271125.1 hypothetical protein [Enterobacter cloacae subsp. cloacae]HCM9540474.1 hypothetical protein [Enterobacter cloacae subsp. cloacae]HCM9542749.1 hypothetical protein [Enterobacter cloacae subsp. cloacae]HDC4406304.1 hypothetical protein [Enterobacter cloacae]